MTTKLEREREFHNQLFAGEERGAGAFYAIAESSFAYYEAKIRDRGTNRRVLEYGCGRTSFATAMASAGATVTGIDISEVAVDTSRALATEQDLEDQLDFQVMDAENLPFESEFDLVCGTGILHHLDLELALRGIARALRPNGSAVFLEPLGHNPVINLYRDRTPTQRSEDEHPLLMSDLRAASEHFSTVRVRFFHLTSLAALALRGRTGFTAATGLLEKLDSALFRLWPRSRSWAWIAVIALDGPRPAREAS
ncbi:MAG TPA: class I SAM-dependent methyltransferase [Thermoleophilaceae bacterium]|nr:class I SAM-dependent methyltransferase [Thermoleophilaceae bacterium]